jgi:hypothetical protein
MLKTRIAKPASRAVVEPPGRTGAMRLFLHGTPPVFCAATRRLQSCADGDAWPCAAHPGPPCGGSAAPEPRAC